MNDGSAEAIRMASINLSQDEISDTLYITFGKNREALGIALNEDFLLRIDPNTHEPIGLTVLNYKQVARSDPLPMDGLSDLPSDLAEAALEILKAPPIGQLVSLFNEHPPQIKSRIHDFRIEDVVGVDAGGDG